MSFFPDQIHTLPLEQQQEFFNRPAMKPPGGQESNLDNPDNKNAIALFTLSFLIIISTVFAALHAIARIVRIKQVRLDDCRCMISNPSSVSNTHGCCRCCSRGLRESSQATIFSRPRFLTLIRASSLLIMP